ncbi:hypothetical protein ILYODFUR_030861 [Ilyodon furcidens]|uniref:Uncharacterized protein n=1 Tax=Ilyodon furcidens TaxID=33524 RepID=A0ABV0V886_9TELE
MKAKELPCKCTRNKLFGLSLDKAASFPPGWSANLAAVTPGVHTGAPVDHTAGVLKRSQLSTYAEPK